MNDAAHIEDSVAIVTITGWVDRIKAFVPEKRWGWMWPVSIAVGIAYAFLAKPGRATVVERVVVGAILGLTASGLFAGANQIGKKMEARAAKK